MIEINDVTDYLPEDSALNKAANAEIRNIVEFITKGLEAIPITDEEDWLVNLNGSPKTLLDNHELDISWESDTEQFDERIKELIVEANR